MKRMVFANSKGENVAAAWGSGKIRVTFETANSAGMIGWAKELLEAKGYVVKKADALHARETPAQFCKRIGLCGTTFCRKMLRPDCPQNFEIQKGPTGKRTLWLKASRELEDFMSSPPIAKPVLKLRRAA
jgi:hypothetical protein